MKIYQVEELVGISKKNIRFYEDEGLLNPDRNPENGYREYTAKDVHQLELIKLLRKLDVPIEEIRLLQQGKLGFSEIMNNQIASLEKVQKDTQIMVDLCHKMKDEITDINQLKADVYLEEMVKMEKEGTKFVDIEKQDINRKKKTGSIFFGVLFCALFLCGIIPGAVILSKNSQVRTFSFIMIGISIVIVVGIIAVLIQRIKEIDKGEEYEARKY